MVGASLQDREDELVALAATLTIAGTIATGLISLAAWLAGTGALRPVESMRRRAAAISAWDPGRRLPAWPGKDELALFGGTLNQMLDRIKDSVDRERQLVDRASHELRTPLAVQRIELDLALSGPQNVAELQAALRSVSQENEHLARLTEDLLVLARARGGVMPVQLLEISLAELLETVRSRTELIPHARGQVSFTAADQHVLVDPVWLRQAIGNLIDNAVRHTPSGTHVSVRADHHDATVRITVEDAGPGFPEIVLGGAFEPSAGSHDSATARRAPAGLGLAVVQAIAEAHGGRVWAENLPGGGARVTMTTSDGVRLPWADRSQQGRHHTSGSGEHE